METKTKFKLIYHQPDETYAPYEEALESFDFLNEDYNNSPQIKEYWNPGTISLIPVEGMECNMVIISLDPKDKKQTVPFFISSNQALLERWDDEISGPNYSILPNGVLLIIHYDL